jgi:hypothetical protein
MLLRVSQRRFVILLAALLLLLVGTVVRYQSHPKNPPLSKPDQATRDRIKEQYGKLPLRFEANQGQTDTQVKFLSRGNGYSLFLTPTEAVLSLSKGMKRTETGVLRMGMVNANPQPNITGMEPMESASNYFIGNDPNQWHSGVRHYGKVKFEEVYPGVDLVYYGNQQQLEYDIVLQPGADHEQIAFDLRGADKIEIDTQGDLVLQIGGSEIRQHRPIVYQETNGGRETIAGNYILKGDNRVGFQVAAYDKSLPLIIDPVLSYSTYFGGSGGGGIGENGNSIAVDSEGIVYVTGFTSSGDFPLVNALQPFYAGGGIQQFGDLFVTKLNPLDGSIIYSTYLGGGSDDSGRAIAVDLSGNAYVTGFTLSTDFPITNGFQTTNGGGINFGDAFVTKINPAGSELLYSTFLGGGADDGGVGIAVDNEGFAYTTGFSSSGNFPLLNPFQSVLNGISDAFVAKLNTNETGAASLIYSTYLGGGGSENVTPGPLIFFNQDALGGITIDTAGNAYITGFTDSFDFPTVNPFQDFLRGQFDAFVAKLSSSGGSVTLEYSTYLGGSTIDIATGIAIDSSANVYVAGLTDSINFPTQNALQPTRSNPFANAFVTKLGIPEGGGPLSLFYSTYLGGNTQELGFGIGVDAEGNAYVTGATLSTDFPTVNAAQSVFGGGPFLGDAFLTKLSPDGSSILLSTYLGGSSEDGGLAIAVSPSGSAYITGVTASTNFPLRGNAFQRNFRGGTDAFVSSFDPGGSLTFSSYLGGSSGDDLAFDIAVDPGGNAYIVGQTSSVTFPVRLPARQPALRGGNTDGFVVKLNPAGNQLIYSSYFGGSSEDFLRSIAVDLFGNAYVTGETASTDFPLLNPLQPALSGIFSFDAFAFKLNAAGGLLVYSTYLGSPGNDMGRAIAVDSDGNAYVAGFTNARLFPVTAGAFQTVFGGGNDGFVTKLNGTGTAIVYSTFLGGSRGEQIRDLAVDINGNAYVTGGTNSTDFPLVNALQSSFGGVNDSFVTKLNAQGSRAIYSTYLGGSAIDVGMSVKADQDGNAYLTGNTISTNFPTTAGAFQVTFGGNGPRNIGDVYVTKLNSTGSKMVYSTYLGGSDDDNAASIGIDSAGNAYVVGFTFSTNFPTANPLQPVCNCNQNRDAFVTKLNSAGSALLYSTFLGGTVGDLANGIAVTPSGDAFVTGATNSIDFPTMNPLQPVNRGVSDAFITKIVDGGSPQFSSATYSVNENQGTATITVTRTGTAPTAVDFSATGGTATDGSDFNAVTGTLSFAAGELRKSFDISIINDDLGEIDETINLSLSNPSNTILDSPSTAVLTIVDDDDSLRFSSDTYMVKENISAVFVTVQRRGNTANAVTVGYSTNDDTAIAPADYTATFGTLKFAPGETEKAFAIPIINDGIGEQSEQVGLILSNPIGASLATSSAVLMIIDDDPAIENFSPESGAVGTSVTITGRNFFGVSSVKFNGVSAPFTVNPAGDQISSTVPAGATTGPITVTTVAGTAMSDRNFMVAQSPTITSFTPTSGKVGTIVSITGTSFTTATSVNFNGVSAGFAINSDSSITTSVPSGATTGKITVTNPAGTATSGNNFTVTASSGPALAAFTPTTGLAGTVVTITGANFSGATAVRFNSINAASFLVTSDTSITATVPAGSVTGRLSVTTSLGTTTSSVSFTQILPPVVNTMTPASGRAGTVVTISGSNLAAVTEVRFNGALAKITSIGPTFVKVTVPAGVTAGPLTVTNLAGTTTSKTIFTVLATITGFSPATGIADDLVRITGIDLGRTTGVKFGIVSAKIISVSDTEIVAAVPATANTGKISVTTTTNGSAISTTNFIMIKPPTISSYSPFGGTVGTSVTISGANISTVSEVRMNGMNAGPISVLSPTSIRVTVPMGATTGSISLVNRAGTATSSSMFKVLAKVVEFTRSAMPNETITIKGMNLTGATGVRFGSINAAPVSVTETEITVKVPATAPTLSKLSVITPSGIGPATTDNFTLIKPPSISSFTPTGSRVDTWIALTGTNLSTVSEVKFNGINITDPVQVISLNSIKVKVPAGATTGKITVMNRAGVSAPSTSTFTVMP